MSGVLRQTENKVNAMPLRNLPTRIQSDTLFGGSAVPPDVRKRLSPFRSSRTSGLLCAMPKA
jgi:hypothetical protein